MSKTYVPVEMFLEAGAAPQINEWIEEVRQGESERGAALALSLLQAAIAMAALAQRGMTQTDFRAGMLDACRMVVDATAGIPEAQAALRRIASEMMQCPEVH